MSPDRFDAERPLGAYLLLAAAYLGVVGGVLAAGRRRGVLLEHITAGDVALLAAGTQRLSRTLSREKISRPLRRPFTEVVDDEAAPPGEVAEDVRGGQSGLRRAIGDLLTCTLCLDQWIATALIGGFLVAPRATRTISALLAVRSLADALQLLQGRLARPHGTGVDDPAEG